MSDNAPDWRDLINYEPFTDFVPAPTEAANFEEEANPRLAAAEKEIVELKTDVMRLEEELEAAEERLGEERELREGLEAAIREAVSRLTA